MNNHKIITILNFVSFKNFTVSFDPLHVSMLVHLFLRSLLNKFIMSLFSVTVEIRRFGSGPSDTDEPCLAKESTVLLPSIPSCPGT